MTPFPARFPLLLLLFLLPLSIAIPARGADTLVYRGDAVDLKTRKPVFTELHREAVEGGRTLSLRTVYLGPSGDTIAERTLDFTAHPYLPRYHLEDFRTGLLEEARPEGGAVVVRHRPGRGKPTAEKRVEAPEPSVLDGGFNAFLKARLDELGRGGKARFHVVVPSRKTTFRFTAHAEAAPEAGTRVLVAEPGNALIRMVAPRIELLYDAGTRRIKRFRGYSNITRADGTGFQAEVTYAPYGP